MSAITQTFARCQEEKRAAFIPFLMAGDPDLKTTGTLLQALADGGADIIELGVPFSDPVADGPINQRAAHRALEAGTTLSGILELVARHRDRLGVPIVLFTYFNPIHARGVDTFAEQAAASGIDGVLLVDLPPDEAATTVPVLQGQGIDTVFLVAPTSTKQRIQKVGQSSSGFIYYVSRTGVTGARERLPKELVRQVKGLRKKVSLPVAVGFGISDPRQAKAVAKVADGVVVGSALVQIVEEKAGEAGLPAALESRCKELSGALGK